MLSSIEQLLSIGEFAQRCGLSRSALRFYDQNGLAALVRRLRARPWGLPAGNPTAAEARSGGRGRGGRRRLTAPCQHLGMPGGPSPPLYRLDELGWLAFDRLCALVLAAEAGLNDLGWSGQSDRWAAAIAHGPLALPGRSPRLQGLVTILAFWIPDRGAQEARFSELSTRLEAALGDRGSSTADDVLLLTNMQTGGAVLHAQTLTRHRRLIVLDATWIGASLDRHPGVRAALPSLLGLRDLGELIDREARKRSSLDVAGAQELARVFWPTRAYQRAHAVLDQHRFVVLTGPPEMGKTAIAQMLALAQLSDGWEAHDCTGPDQVWRALDGGRRQVFVADDAFGSTEYRPDSSERWARELGRLLGALDDEHWLIWTSRPAPLKAGLRRVQQERRAERFPAPSEVLVDASDLDLQEKTLILFRHAKARAVNDAARELVRNAGPMIVEHPHFTPERIRRLMRERAYALPALPGEDQLPLVALIERELANPTQAMRNSFCALGLEHRDLLVSLLDAPAGLIDQRTLAATIRRHHRGGLSRPPGELIDRLTDHFLRVTPLGIGWVHPSWRDLVIDQLHTDASARQRFLAGSGIDGLTLALSVQGGERGERTLPLLATDGDWDRLGDRLHELLRELEPRELARVLLALVATLSETIDARQRREARGLAAALLDTTRQLWDERRQILPAFVLDAWYRLRDHAPPPIRPPWLAGTWAELHPGRLLTDRRDRHELTQAEEWLALAQVLQDHHPAALETLGFPDRDRDLLERLIVMITRTRAPDEPLRDLQQGLLRRIERLVPELAVSARGALTIAELADELERKRWFAPLDIPAPPGREPAAAGTGFTRRDVDRVLRDL
ncbi:MAG: MerR family DNA-binding transcriptional regulator [Solirubrobacteraceae bacterium]